MSADLFVSDLHLTDARPDSTALFFEFLERTASNARRLYVLGDLFEIWVGDDGTDENVHQDAPRRLRTLSDAGVELYFLPGNRDFLLGTEYARRCGFRLLPDPAHIQTGGLDAVLMHGDTLCTDDHAYQAWRTQARDPGNIRAFLTRPLHERQAFARQLRRTSEDEKTRKDEAIMDVNPEAVANAFRTHAHRPLIHGHTHRPAHHLERVDGRSCDRWVLPAWYEGGGYLRVDERGWELVRLHG